MSRHPKRIRAVLLDLSGTLHIDKDLIPGAVEAVSRLQTAGKRVRFLTNTSKQSSQSLWKQLIQLGLVTAGHDHNDLLLTSVLATRNYLLQHQLRPFCLMEDTTDFSLANIPLDPPHNCVVIGLAPTQLDYNKMNQAFQILISEHNTLSTTNNNKLIAIHKGKYYRDENHHLSLGPGAFVAGLEMASNCVPAIVMGKPSREFFESALYDGISAEETAMVGDDVLQDVRGAMEAGMGMSILVQTGKFRPGDEDKIQKQQLHPIQTVYCCPSIVEAVEYILAQDSTLND
jgi:HAD superfamily hydrolase (TIGR01458 family)